MLSSQGSSARSKPLTVAMWTSVSGAFYSFTLIADQPSRPWCRARWTLRSISLARFRPQTFWPRIRQAGSTGGFREGWHLDSSLGDEGRPSSWYACCDRGRAYRLSLLWCLPLHGLYSHPPPRRTLIWIQQVFQVQARRVQILEDSPLEIEPTAPPVVSASPAKRTPSKLFSSLASLSHPLPTSPSNSSAPPSDSSASTKKPEASQSGPSKRRK